MERPMAVQRRRGRPQLRSLGPVVTLGHPLGTPKLQTGPSAAREASFHLVKSPGAQRTYRVWAFALQDEPDPRKKYSWVGLPPLVHPPTERANSAASSVQASSLFCVTSRPLRSFRPTPTATTYQVVLGAISTSRGRRRSLGAATYSPSAQRGAGSTPVHLLGLQHTKPPSATDLVHIVQNVQNLLRWNSAI